MTSLDSIGLDLFKEICCYLSSKDLFRLWSCGNSHLNALTTNGALPELCFDESCIFQRQWPHFPSYLPNLKHLQVYCTRNDEMLSISGLELHSLPRSLESLECRFYGCLSAFIDQLSYYDQQLSLEHLSTLKLIDSQPIKSLPRLPRSITCLELSCRELPSVHIDYLPPYLTSLKLSKIMQMTGTRFPQSLTIADFAVGNRHLRLLPLLPTSLLDLTFQYHDQCEVLPDECQSADWGRFHSLTRLYFGGPCEIPPERFRDLPTSLNELILCFHPCPDINYVPYFPPNLQKFRTRSAVSVQASDFRPGGNFTSLESLILQMPLSPAEFVSLPQCLTELACYSIPGERVPVRALPRNMKRITLGSLDGCQFSDLPPYLECLNLTVASDCTCKSYYKLPGTLRKLVLTDAYFTDWNETLRPGLNLPHLETLTLGTACPKTRVLLATMDVSSLPPTLECLRCVVCPETCIENFQLLWRFTPRLKSLTLNSRGMNASGLMGLPESLSSLVVAEIQGWNATVLKSLPRSLVYFSCVAPFPIDQRDLDYLPKGLQGLHLARCCYTAECQPFLPKRLLSFTLQNRIPPWWRPSGCCSEPPMPQRCANSVGC